MGGKVSDFLSSSISLVGVKFHSESTDNRVVINTVSIAFYHEICPCTVPERIASYSKVLTERTGCQGTTIYSEAKPAAIKASVVVHPVVLKRGIGIYPGGIQ